MKEILTQTERVHLGTNDVQLCQLWFSKLSVARFKTTSQAYVKKTVDMFCAGVCGGVGVFIVCFVLFCLWFVFVFVWLVLFGWFCFVVLCFVLFCLFCFILFCLFVGWLVPFVNVATCLEQL